MAGTLKSFIIRRLEARKFDPTISKFLGNLVRISVIALSIIASLGVFGMETTSFAAVLAGAGLAVGMALQGSLSNFAAGVLLLVFRPFKVGDYITVAGSDGTVKEIDLFVTGIDTLDNRRIIVPNGQIFGAVIQNVTFHDIRRADVNVGVAYREDLDRTREILLEAARSVPTGLQDPAPAVVMVNLGASSVDWQVRVWCKTSDYWETWEQTRVAAKKSLDKAGLVIPFPQIDVHMPKAG